MTNFSAIKKVLLIDNQDSFTFNIVDLLRKFPEMDLKVKSSINLDINQLDFFDYLIISPGPMTPKDFPVLNQVIDFAKTGRKPLLGVCLGHQAICSHFGAKLSKLSEVIHGQQHEIEVSTDTKLYSGLPEELKVGLYHSWHVEKDSLPESLQITAQSRSGILMSVEHRHLPIFGIQYHPESFLTPQGQEILTNFFDPAP